MKPRVSDCRNRLTPRQREVLDMLLEGQSEKQIALGAVGLPDLSRLSDASWCVDINRGCTAMQNTEGGYCAPPFFGCDVT